LDDARPKKFAAGHPVGEDPAAAAAPARMLVRVLQNTLYGAGGRLLGLAVSIVLVPYVVNRLGVERYGLYALAAALTGYLGLLDLGFGTGYVKYVAEAHARRDDRAVNEVVATGFYAYLVFGAALFGLWWLTAPRIVALVGVGGELGREAVAAFTVSVAILALSGSASAFRAVLYGLQRIDLATRVGVALIVPRVAAVIWVLESGRGLVGLVLADLALFVVGAAAMAGVARAVFPALSLSPSGVSVERLRTMFRYGLQLQVSRASEIVNFHFDKLLLARFVGLTAVTSYDLGARLLTTARSFPLVLLSALVPAISDLDARGKSMEVEETAIRIQRWLLVVATPVFAGLMVGASDLIMLWLGPGHQASAVAVRILATGYLMNVISGSFTAVTQGIARNEYQVRVTLFALVINVVASSALVMHHGYLGVLVGTAGSMIAAYIYAELRFRRLSTELTGSSRLRSAVHVRPFAAAAVAAALALIVAAVLPEAGGRLMAGLRLGALTASFGLVYGAIGWALRLLESGDLALLRAALARR